jgi:hypothetical protein
MGEKAIPPENNQLSTLISEGMENLASQAVAGGPSNSSGIRPAAPQGSGAPSPTSKNVSAEMREEGSSKEQRR